MNELVNVLGRYLEVFAFLMVAWKVFNYLDSIRDVLKSQGERVQQIEGYLEKNTSFRKR